ncbi:MAG TPA: hypothetical protein PKA64_18805 [Myxococcota bacterium]|nr:hypothetical protein [Myxococcota bacterium]
MFRHARAPGQTIHRVSIDGVDEAGQRVLAVRPRGWRRQAVDALATRASLREDLLRVIADSWNTSQPEGAAHLVRVEAIDQQFRLTPAPVARGRTVLAAVDL